MGVWCQREAPGGTGTGPRPGQRTWGHMITDFVGIFLICIFFLCLHGTFFFFFFFFLGGGSPMSYVNFGKCPMGYWGLYQRLTQHSTENLGSHDNRLCVGFLLWIHIFFMPSWDP